MSTKIFRWFEVMGLLGIVFMIDRFTDMEVNENTFLVALVVSLILNQKRGNE